MTLGTDFAGWSDVDPSLGYQSDSRALADAILRRLTTPRGGLPDFPGYGFDVSSLIGRALEPNSISQRVLEQVRAEEEVLDAALDIETSADGTGIILSLRVVSSDGPFTLTVPIEDLDASAIIPGDE